MQLIRNWSLQGGIKHKPPCNEHGYFFALANANDLPSGKSAFTDANAMLKHGALYWQDANKPDTWERVHDVAILKKLQKQVTASFDDDYEACTTGYSFMIELFFIPRNFRGKRLIKRCQNRAFKI